MMDKLRWLFGMRYELSIDGAGLLKYLSPTNSIIFIRTR